MRRNNMHHQRLRWALSLGGQLGQRAVDRELTVLAHCPDIMHSEIDMDVGNYALPNEGIWHSLYWLKILIDREALIKAT